MENDTNDLSYLAGNLLLPPRKRLLPGMIRQNLETNLSTRSLISCNGSEFEVKMNDFLRSHLSSNPNLSNDEIVEASRSAAIEKSKVAKAARAVAEEKASKAAMAVAAARKALQLVEAVNEESDSNNNQEKYLKKNRMKKRVAIQSLYGKHNGVYSCKTEEELAAKLHQVINSSSRMLKNTTSRFESDDPIYKKAKIGTDDVDFEMGKSVMKEKDDNRSIDKKKPRIKQKMLPLSICNVKDLEIPKVDDDDHHNNNSKNGRKSLFSIGASSESVEMNSTMWKCKGGLKVSSCVKQNKVMQS